MAQKAPSTIQRPRKSWANQVSAVSGTHPAWLVLSSSLWMGFFGNLALWQELSGLVPLLNWQGAALLLGLGGLISAATAAVLSLAAWRWTLKPAIVLCLLVVAVSSHFALTYRTLVDAAMVVNVLQTDPREVLEFINLSLGITVLFLAVLPAWWVLRQPVQRLNLPSQAAVNGLSAVAFAILALVLVWAMTAQFRPLLGAHPQLPYMANPLNSVWGAAQVVTNTWKQAAGARAAGPAPGQRGPSHRAGNKPQLLVLVLGDSVRGDHLGVNGYIRQTTPQLAQEDILSWRQARSCGTSTATGIPCVLSAIGPVAPSLWPLAEQHNLLDALQSAGLAVLWLENQFGCKGLCGRAVHIDTSRMRVEGLCGDDGCLDEVMLLNLNDRLRSLPEDRRKQGVVVVMHAIGSHGPAYHKRSNAGFKKFLPECTQNLLSECQQQQVANAYDNTLLYTDHFLAETVQWLKRQSGQYTTSMLYVSDHGESLGEQHQYLHGQPSALAPPEQRHVPLLAWLSASQQQRSRVSSTCLRGHTHDEVGHRNVFHSVMGLLDIQHPHYQRELDLFAACAR